MFINRQDDINYLRSDFKTSEGRSRFLIISGISGIGKSELVNQAFADFENFIRVKVAKHEGVRNIPTLFVKELARAINYLSVRTNAATSFTSHFKEKEKSFKSVIRKIIADLAENNNIIPSKELGRLFRADDSAQDSVEKIFISDYNEAYIITCSYVKELLKGQRFVIALENIQNIDKESLLFFRELLVLNPMLYIIGEYTTDDEAEISEFDLLNYFSGHHTKTDILGLKKLPLKEILKECKDKPEIISAILNDSYESSKGNLHPLQMLVSGNLDIVEVAGGSAQTPQYDDIIVQELRKLDSEQCFFLAAIVAHAGVVDYELFRTFLVQENLIASITGGLRSIDEFVDELVHRRLLVRRQSEIQTAQDSIIECVFSYSLFEKYLFISYRKWIVFYQTLRKKEDVYITKSECLSWEMLFKAYLNDLSGINELLQEIYRLTLLSSAPKRAIRFLEKVKDGIKKNNINTPRDDFSEAIDFKIIQVLYRLWYFDEIHKYSLGNLANPRVLLFHISSLALIGRAEEAILLCNHEIEKLSNRNMLPFQIARIAAYRASNRYEDCETEWLSIYKSSLYKDTAYEGLFLRCADFARMSDHVEQMDCLIRSVEFFVEHSDVLNEISARIALAQHFGYDGQLENAEAELKLAEEKSRLFFIEHYVINNNLSVLELQKNNVSPAILEKFKQAAALCSITLDRFIIWNNMFIAQSMLGLKEEANATLKVIEEKIYKGEVPDYDLQRIAFFNAYIFHSENNSLDLAEHYLIKAKQFPVLSDHDFWQHKLEGIINHDYDDFRFSYKHYPVYLTYWHFDFDSLQDNFELTIE